jgi:hypothetical protein
MRDRKMAQRSRDKVPVAVSEWTSRDAMSAPMIQAGIEISDGHSTLHSED